MMKRLLTLILVFGSMVAAAQTRPGSLRGTVKDKATGETLPFANVVLKQRGVQIKGGTTDFEGNYNISPLDPGTYDVEYSFSGYATLTLQGIEIVANRPTVRDVQIQEKNEMLIEVIVKPEENLIETGRTSTEISAKDIENLPFRNIGQIVATTAGVFQSDDGQGVNVRGARESTNVIFIDGVKVRGSSDLPRDMIQSTEIITGGLPAQYGDVTGGVISTTTKGPAPYYFGTAEILTSSPFDQYHYNLGALTIGGPILKYKSGPKKGRPLVGFLFGGEYQFDNDGFPRALPIYRIDDAQLDNLQRNPLTPSNIGLGVLNSAEFLRQDAFNTQSYRQNAQRHQVRMTGNIRIMTGDNSSLTVGGRFNSNDGMVANRNQSLVNYDNNLHSTNRDWTVLARYQQRFGASGDSAKKSLISNAFYMIQVDYTRNSGRTWDPRFEDDLFKYGHIGEFKTNQRRFFVPGSDTISDPNDPDFGRVLNGWTQATWQDVGVDFTPGPNNPVLANYTSNYFDFIDNRLIQNNNLSLEGIRAGGGLLNGDAPRSIYGLWGNVGGVHNIGNSGNQYSQFQNSQFRVTASSTFDIKKHSLIVGFEYEQRTDRFYGVNGTGLWTLMRLLQNDAIRELDRNNPIAIRDEFGVFQDTIIYNRLFDPSKPRTFDRNLRNSLGLDENGTDWLDIDSYDPSTFSIDMFSANELLNIGSTQYVSYYGYDYTGNIQNSNPGLADFFGTDANGIPQRSVGAFQPIYMAGYIQDQFQFNDLFFNVGVRIDRFDANQPVLKDLHTLYPAYTVGDLGSTSLSGLEVPQGMGNNFVVYVDDVNNPTRIVGYRDGFTWYNESGVLEPNPKRIADQSGGIQPFLKRPNEQTLASTYNESFVDYTPQVTVSPRISFQFPISDEAEFFAHYDLLVQRPDPGLNRFDPISFLQLENGTGGFISNPNLLPQRTTDYEIGFRQRLTENSALKISAFYREMRDMMQTVAVVEAYPLQYITWGNQDYGTVKGFTLGYDLRRSGNMRINANYTLQFADGSGSGPNSGANLARSGQPNLRYILPLDYDSRHQVVMIIDYRFARGGGYNGPVIKNKNILEDFGVNLVVNGFSGTPYTKRSRAFPLTDQASSIPLVGNINGARLPWQFRLDMNINKVFQYSYGEDGKKKKGNIDVYLQIQNVLDALNVLNVYAFSGSPSDDGWLTSQQGINSLSFQADAQSYADFYNMSMQNPAFFTLPRRMRLGVRFTF